MTPLVTPNHRIIAGRHSSDHQPPRGRCAAVSRASSCLAAELDRVGAVATGEAARSLLSLSRPALDFTALATGLGKGGGQNGPLGRAVIGGLLFATLATLFFVPCVFSIIHGWLERRRHRAVALRAAQS